jgi:hypothetical protein
VLSAIEAGRDEVLADDMTQDWSKGTTDRERSKVVVHVATIHHQDRARRPLLGARHTDLMSLAISDYPVAGQATVVIEKKMQFDGPLAALGRPKRDSNQSTQTLAVSPSIIDIGTSGVCHRSAAPAV